MMTGTASYPPTFSIAAASDQSVLVPLMTSAHGATDEQIDALIRDILDTAEPDDRQRAAVREWLANL